MDQRTIVVVGGGAGGMCAALGAAARSKAMGAAVRIVLLERNPRVGIKIRISGGGKCNITHEGSIEDVLRLGFLDISERRFLKHAFYRYTNLDILAMLERHGVAWHARENGRIFPDSGRADDVLHAFEEELREAGVEVINDARVSKLRRAGEGFELLTDQQDLTCDALILATGGVSYQKVGTTGDGIRFAESLGHEIIPLRSALAPIYLTPTPPSELHGVAVREATLKVHRDHEILSSAEGDVLITHRGISGPATLDISRQAALALEEAPIRMSIDMLSVSIDEAHHLLVKLQQERATQQIKTWLEEIVPNRLAPYILRAAGIEVDSKWNSLKRDARSELLKTLTGFALGQVADIPIDRGEVSAGGVSLKDISSKTMMSKKLPRLFFAGEMLDIAGEIGGYNHQAAYSTGWVAGQEAVTMLAQSN